MILCYIKRVPEPLDCSIVASIVHEFENGVNYVLAAGAIADLIAGLLGIVGRITGLLSDAFDASAGSKGLIDDVAESGITIGVLDFGWRYLAVTSLTAVAGMGPNIPPLPDTLFNADDGDTEFNWEIDSLD